MRPPAATGLRDALGARGLESVATLARPSSVPAGRAAARLLLERADPPTALVCGNDILAFGALAEAQAMGIAVPGAVSITGFDDLDLASPVTPPLTTVRVPSAAWAGSRRSTCWRGSPAATARMRCRSRPS